jgi:flagellar basal-body rod protein FlgF
MLTGLYSSASGMIVQERVQDVIAQNLANSQMPGYQRSEMVVRSFPDVMLKASYDGLSTTTNKNRFNHAIGRVGTGAGVDWIYTNSTSGGVRYSGEPTDMAIDGDGYFSLITPDGVRFSRTGNFHVNNEGYLVNNQGYYVMGQGTQNNRTPGPIKVGGDDFRIGDYGYVYTKQKTQDAAGKTVYQEVELDQLRVADFEDKDKLFREPGNIYRCEEDDMDNFKIPDHFRVAQGYVEQSNAVPTTEMVKLIDSFRVHEASARVIRALDQTLGKAVNEIAR